MWTSEKLYFDGDEYYRDAIQGIDDAKISVTLETYIYDQDEIGRRFEEALLRAAQRGTHVRVLVDGIGGGAWADRNAKRLEAAGIRVRVYHPVRIAKAVARWFLSFGARMPMAEHSSRMFARINRRDHRKIVVIDEQVAWVGSLNISAHHSRECSGARAWRDTAVRIEGPNLCEILDAFEYGWNRAHTAEGKRRWADTLLPRQGKDRKPSGLVRVNYTLLLRRRNYHDFLKRMRLAKNRIWITNAYLAPSTPLLSVLNKAAQRGVDVRILVPRDSDVFFMPWVASAHYAMLISGGVRIFEYLPSFIHAKSVMIDEWAEVGTSNLNRRSLLKDFEIDIVLTKAESRTALERQYAADLRLSEEVKIARGGWKAWLGRRLMSTMKNWI